MVSCHFCAFSLARRAARYGSPARHTKGGDTDDDDDDNDGCCSGI